MNNSVSGLKAATATQPQLPVWLTHIWQRLDRKRLGLILGAGISIDAGCPSWHGLVRRLADRVPDLGATFDAHRGAGLQDTYLTQILYSLHQKATVAVTPAVPQQFEQYQIDSTWMETVHQELYKDICKFDFNTIAKQHPYLLSLGQLACRAAFTVNFNFDDLVDEAAINFAKSRNKEPPEIISRPKIETRLNAPVIYHINGSLPREPRRRRSETLVFTEDAFADVLISPTTHDSDFLMSRFASTTFLLLGTSLNDNSLKNMLRAGMKRSPANHHYIVYWKNPAKPRSAEEQEHIFDVNLSVYNLISIFLDTGQIAEMIDLLNEDQEKLFEQQVLSFADNLKTRRRYYLVGSVVAGKSSTLEALRCFTTFEEWSGRVPEKMYQDHNTLTEADREEIDDWLYNALREKNDRMRNVGVGIHIMDRGYLDLCAFSKTPEENLRKLEELRKRVHTVNGPLEKGQIIFLQANEDVLSERQAKRGRLRRASQQIDYDGNALAKQSKILEAIYRPDANSTFDNSREACEQSSRRVAREILLGDYNHFDFEKRIDELIKNGGKP